MKVPYRNDEGVVIFCIKRQRNVKLARLHGNGFQATLYHLLVCKIRDVHLIIQSKKLLLSCKGCFFFPDRKNRRLRPKATACLSPHLSDKSLTLSWKNLHINTHSLRTSSAISTSSRNLLATISRASSGQACNSSKTRPN